MKKPQLYIRSVRSALVPCLLLAAAPALSTATRIVTTASAREFLAGDAKGTAVTADGRLTIGAPLSQKWWPEDAADAVVFASVSDHGRVYVATGGGLGRLFVCDASGKVTLLFTSPEPNLTAIAVAPDGGVVVGGSPNGKIYRVEAKASEGKSDPAKSGVEWGDPKEPSIWSLAFAKDGTLYVGTGNRGRVFKRSTDGKLALFHELEDQHVRSLFVGRDGKVYAGSSDAGLVVAIAPDGTARTVHDFTKPEVIGIVEGRDGVLYAAATNAEPSPISAGGVPVPSPGPTPTGGGSVPSGSVSVSTSTRLASLPSGQPSRDRGAEIVAISADGFVEPAWSFADETIYSLRYDAALDELILTTGPKGRVYAWKARHVRLLAQTEQQVAVAAPPVPGGFATVTMNAVGVFLPATPAKGTGGSFIAASKDAGRLSVFGRLRWEGQVPSGGSVKLSARAGNSEKPDRTWSAWVPVGTGGEVPRGQLPAARFFQWKADLASNGKGEAPVLERVELSYSERNARPVLENVALLEPGAVFPRASASGTAVLSVTNPDETGIYGGLESPREGNPEGPGKRLYRKGFRTLSWKGTDPNGDNLRYDLDGRRDGESVWFPIKRDVDEAYYSFDTTALPDGRYRFRVTASDRTANPEGQALTATEESPVAVVDNTSPVLKLESAKVEGGEVVLRVRFTDTLSPFSKAEGAVNADRWRVLTADDAVADALSEIVSMRVPKPSGPAVLAIRVVDASGNVAALSAEYPRDFK